MKRRVKFLAALSAAIMLVSGSTVIAGAADGCADGGCNMITISACGSCKGGNIIKSLLDQKGCNGFQCVLNGSNCGDVQCAADESCGADCRTPATGCKGVQVIAKGGNCNNVQSIIGKSDCEGSQCPAGENNCNSFQDLLKKYGCGDLRSLFSGNGCNSVKPEVKETVPQATEPAESPAATQPATEKATEPAETQPAATAPVKETEPKATQASAQAVTQPAALGYDEYADEVIRLVNVERAKYGLPALNKDEGATAVAQLRAKEIVQSFSHTRPNGTSCFTAASELGVSYRSAGENIAYGYPTPEAVVTGWMNSEGHRANILSSSFTSIGVGCYKSGNTLYWSQFFIG